MSLNLLEVSQRFQHVPPLCFPLGCRDASGCGAGVLSQNIFTVGHRKPGEHGARPLPPSAAWGAGDGQARLKGKPWAAEGTQLCCGRLLRLLCLSRAAGGAPRSGLSDPGRLERENPRPGVFRGTPGGSAPVFPRPPSVPARGGGCSKQGSSFPIPQPAGLPGRPRGQRGGQRGAGPAGGPEIPSLVGALCGLCSGQHPEGSLWLILICSHGRGSRAPGPGALCSLTPRPCVLGFFHPRCTTPLK